MLFNTALINISSQPKLKLRKTRKNKIVKPMRIKVRCPNLVTVTVMISYVDTWLVIREFEKALGGGGFQEHIPGVLYNLTVVLAHLFLVSMGMGSYQNKNHVLFSSY